MKIILKDFQRDTVAELRDKFRAAQRFAETTPVAILLNAPTGSGKTLMATALIDDLLGGSEDDGSEGEPDLVFVWLTDQPELNKQTFDKVLATSSILTTAGLQIVDVTFDLERFAAGKLYFLNTQKLGTGTSFVKHGDDRTFTLWESLANSVAASPSKFVLFIDEAHRGSRGREALEAETIMQQFMKGNSETPAIPLVIGISATPDRFVKLCNETNRPVLRVDVEPEVVRESGLLKEFVDLYHPDESQPNDETMLREAIVVWQEYYKEWAAYGIEQGQSIESPVLLIQVEDARTGSSSPSRTDLTMVVDTLIKVLSPLDPGWIAHAFQDDSAIELNGTAIRHLAPSAIDSDPDVKVVLFKTSLNTGWDCPRAETMVSFRSAKDETNIAQLVGRMVRAPLGRRVDANEFLNSVALYLPAFDRKTVKKVVARLTSDPSMVPPTQVRDGRDVTMLTARADANACFAALRGLPSYTIPRNRPLKPVVRLAKLAGLLSDLSFGNEPVKEYRSRLITIIEEERARLSADPQFKKRLDEAGVLDIRRERLNYAAKDGRETRGQTTGSSLQAAVADNNVDDLYAEAGRILGEGLHREYLRSRRNSGAVDNRQVKLELFSLVEFPEVILKIGAAADLIRKEWISAHKASLRQADEKYRQIFREIEGGGPEPELFEIEPPQMIQGRKDATLWPKHIYVDSVGEYHEEFRSSWERRVLEAELAREEIVGWLRNPDRKPWSLCIKRLENTKWVGIYPDFIFFRQTASGLMPDIVDPHLLADEFAPRRAAALAQYAADHGHIFGRIELVIYGKETDTVGKRLNLTNEQTRKNVAGVSTHTHLRHLFDTAPAFS